MRVNTVEAKCQLTLDGIVDRNRPRMSRMEPAAGCGLGPGDPEPVTSEVIPAENEVGEGPPEGGDLLVVARVLVRGASVRARPPVTLGRWKCV